MNRDERIQKLEELLDRAIRNFEAFIGDDRYTTLDLQYASETIERLASALSFIRGPVQPAIPAPSPRRHRELQIDDQSNP